MLLATLLAGFLPLGCSKDPGPPPPLAVEQIPAELNKMFKDAKQDAKDLVAKLNSSLESKDYPAAYDAVQALGNLGDTTIPQRQLSARAMLTIYGLLQTAQSQGDEKAAESLQYHKMTK